MSLSAARWGAALFILGSIASAASPARGQVADEKEVCASAFERGQELEQAGRLKDARAAFVRCAAPTCPLILTPPCVKAVQRLDEEIPSIVIAARGSQGEDIGDARVLIDGELRAERLDGKAIPLDPGSHRVRVERRGSSPVEVEILVRVGERNRAVRVALADPPPPVPGPAPERPPSAGSPMLTSKVPAIAAFAIGGVGVSVGAVAGALALANKLDLDEACPTQDTCDPSRAGQIAAMKTQSTVSTIGFAVGAAGLAVGAVLFVVAGRAPGAAKVAAGRAPGPAKVAAGRAPDAARVSGVVGPGSIGLRGTF